MDMSETLTSGLTLTIPTLGEQNWDQLIRNQCFLPISEHDHTGSGNGAQLSTNAIQGDAITGLKIRLANDQALRARNAANSSDRQILKLDSSDQIVVGHDTSDGSDTLRTFILGGGGSTFSTTRGACISLAGNEHGSPGILDLRCGNVASSYIDLRSDGSHDINFTTNGTNRWQVDGSSGTIAPKSNNTYDFGEASFGIKDFYLAGTIKTFPSASWSPSYGAGGSMTFTSVTTNLARYHEVGKMVSCYVAFRGTTGGTASNYLTFTLPFTSYTSTDGQWCAGVVINSGSANGVGLLYIPSGSSTAQLYRNDQVNYTLGANTYGLLNFTYLIA